MRELPASMIGEQDDLLRVPHWYQKWDVKSDSMDTLKKIDLLLRGIDHEIVFYYTGTFGDPEGYISIMRR